MGRLRLWWQQFSLHAAPPTSVLSPASGPRCGVRTSGGRLLPDPSPHRGARASEQTGPALAATAFEVQVPFRFRAFKLNGTYKAV